MLIRLFAVLATFAAALAVEPFESPRSDGSEVVEIIVTPPGTGWMMGFAPDGQSSAQYGSTFGDGASSPKGAVKFRALLKAVGRLKIEKRERCGTQVAVRKQGETSTTAFFISDDTLFRYLADSLEQEWKPVIEGGRFRELLRLFPMFPDDKRDE